MDRLERAGEEVLDHEVVQLARVVSRNRQFDDEELSATQRAEIHGVPLRVEEPALDGDAV